MDIESKRFLTSISQEMDEDEQQELKSAAREALLTSIQKGRIDILISFLEDRHAALKIVTRHGEAIHLATVFAKTEYDLCEQPDNDLEIKVDEPILTTENVSSSISPFVKTLLSAETNPYSIRVFNSLRELNIKTPSATVKPNGDITFATQKLKPTFFNYN